MIVTCDHPGGSNDPGRSFWILMILVESNDLLKTLLSLKSVHVFLHMIRYFQGSLAVHNTLMNPLHQVYL